MPGALTEAAHALETPYHKSIELFIALGPYLSNKVLETTYHKSIDLFLLPRGLSGEEKALGNPYYNSLDWLPFIVHF
jgi:hypothetical protein